MTIDTGQIITAVDANQNTPRTTCIADEYSTAPLLKNNQRNYTSANLEVELDLDLTDDEKIDAVARHIMIRFKPAFLELAK